MEKVSLYTSLSVICGGFKDEADGQLHFIWNRQFNGYFVPISWDMKTSSLL